MKILMYRWKAYNQFDLINALEKRGHEVDTITGEMANFEEDDNFRQKLVEVLNRTKYDMVMTINYFPIISDTCQDRNIPYVSWCCDSPVSTMYNQSVFNTVNTIFTFDMLNQLEFQDMKAPVLYLPLCTEVERVDELLKDSDDGYDYDIAFVGSMYRKNSYDQVYDHFSDYLKGYFDAALKMQMNVYGVYMLDDILDAKTVSELNRHFVLAKTDRSFSDLSLIFSTTVLSFKIAELERQSVIAQLSERHKVDIFTDDDEITFVNARKHGTVDYWSEAPFIYRRSKINLNLSLRSIRSGIPLRVWDILGAGGFCLTNYQPELLMYFENKKDLVIFESREDMIEKIDYYLKHEDERKQIALNGYNKVKKLHQYEDRLNDIHKIIPEI